MAVTTLTVVTLARTGKDITTGAAALVAATATFGNKFANSGAEFAIVKNASGGAVVVTLTVPALVDGQAVTSPTVTVAAGSTVLLGPFPPGIYSDSGGFCTLTFDVVTSITVGAFKLP